MTICALQREFLFGTAIGEKIQCTSTGKIIEACWREIPEHFPEVTLDAFVVMPNHIHGIIQLSRGETAVGAGHARRLQVIVGSFKAAVSKRAGAAVWQRNYYEHVIRNEDDLNRIRRYIDQNPIFWPVDKDNPAYRP